MSNDPSQIPVQPVAFQYPLPNFAQCLQSLRPAKVVALGSSTTAGEGGIVAYPYRLEALLRLKYPDLMIDVLNRGIGGQEAPAELARLERDVIAEQPSLVIWQVGTNAVWQPPDQHPPSLGETIEAVQEGVERLRKDGRADVILMDLQFVPALLTPAKAGATKEMVLALTDLARKMEVNIFRRFELMKGWHEIEEVSFDLMVDPGDPPRLHDSNWSTQRLTGTLKDQIVSGVAMALAAQKKRNDLNRQSPRLLSQLDSKWALLTSPRNRSAHDDQIDSAASLSRPWNFAWRSLGDQARSSDP